MSALPRTTPPLGYTSRPFDAWTVAGADIEPVGSYATLALAQEALHPLACGVALLGGEPRWWHPDTTPHQQRALQPVLAAAWRFPVPTETPAAPARPGPTLRIERGERVWSDYQMAVFAAVEHGSAHLIVTARAGSGKTTTILEAARRARKRDGKISVLLLMFNRRNVDELTPKAPAGADVLTTHTLGLRALQRAWGKAIPEGKDGDRLKAHVGAAVPSDLTTDDRSQVEALVKWAKITLAETDAELEAAVLDRGIFIAWEWYSDKDGEPRYGAGDLYKWVRAALAMACTPSLEVSFDDMIYVPVKLGLRTGLYDLVFVDETQDLSVARVRLALAALRKGGRIVAVGDDRQAIYGFTGADPRSMENLAVELGASLRGVTHLSLLAVYRCGSRIVFVAAAIVPDLVSPPGIHEGTVEADVSRERMEREAGPGDFVLSRVNAPLVSLCLAFLTEGRPARVQGRDIGASLVKIVRKSKAFEVRIFLPWLGSWEASEVERLELSRASKTAIEGVRDRAQALRALSEGMRSTQQIVDRILELFRDDGEADQIVLSSVHKAKGLETDRVWILRETFLRKLDDEGNVAQEEWNLLYVAITRAKQALFIVGVEP